MNNNNTQEIEIFDAAVGTDMDGNTSIEEIDAESINLIYEAIDGSGSMTPYENVMRDCLSDMKTALSESKNADEILIARADFATHIQIGGYKKIDDFDTSYRAMGSTKLYDVIVEGAQKLIRYRQSLMDNGMRVKAVFAVFTDGQDMGSVATGNDAKMAIEELNKLEITTVFISFGQDAAGIAKDLKFRNELPVGSSASDLRHAFDQLSKSVIEASKSAVAPTDNFFDI